MLLLQIIASKSRMPEWSVITPNPGLTIRKALTKEKRKEFFFNLIQTAKTEQDYKGLEDLLNSSDGLVNASDTEGTTALMIASALGNKKTVIFLIEKGANVNIRDIHDMSAFLYARDNNNKDIQMLLLKKGASARPINNRGGARTRRRSRKSKGTRRR